MIPLLTAAEMAEWDRRAVAERGVPERALMEAAGRAVADAVDRLHPRGRVVGVTGPGKNGGDTLIALRTLAARGREVAAVAIDGRRPEEALAHGWSIRFVDGGEVEGSLASAGVILDGILGTGASGAPRPPQAAMILRINAAGRPVLAVDGPSGVDLTTGSVEGEAVRADVTVTFGAVKRGLLLYPGRLRAGRILLAEVGFPPLDDSLRSAGVITQRWVREAIPEVPPNAHKGTLGNVVVVAGRTGVAGAAALVGQGAARSGAGKVYLLSAAENREILQTLLPEALFLEEDELDEALALADSIVAGPGIGTDERARRLLARVFEGADVPLLVDADGLTLMAHDTDLRPRPGTRVLLTPHPGELSRMIGLPVPEIVADPFGAVQRGLQAYDGVLLLKGSPSLVGSRSAPTLANVSGHSGIATGGMGDTLAGVAGALLAAGAAPYEAAAIALHLSGRAAELAGRGRGLLPRDVADRLPDAILADETGFDWLPGVLLDLPMPK